MILIQLYAYHDFEKLPDLQRGLLLSLSRTKSMNNNFKASHLRHTAVSDTRFPTDRAFEEIEPKSKKYIFSQNHIAHPAGCVTLFRQKHSDFEEDFSLFPGPEN